jgi:hypothetical protein
MRGGFAELVYMLVVVKHHHDDDNERDGKEVGAQELLYDVPVKPFEQFMSEQVPLHITGAALLVLP